MLLVVFVLVVAWILWQVWRFRRKAAGLARPRADTWPDVLLIGHEQPRGQAALVGDDAKIGDEIQASGDRWIISDLERVGDVGWRAWLVNLSERDRRKLRDARADELMPEAIEAVNAIAMASLRPLLGVPATVDVAAIAGYQLRGELQRAVMDRRLAPWGIDALQELPDAGVWPEIRIRDDGTVHWDPYPMARALAARRARLYG